MQKTDPCLKDFVDTIDIITPLNPREAFFGGRTNAIKLYHKVEENEEIHYKDMISLYPCANLECDYPTGHPQFIDQPETTDITRYYGLVKCKILPPYELYHPVLPYRSESKLSFPLCRTCIKQQPAISKRSEKCPHSIEERCLTGTWTTIELNEDTVKQWINQPWYHHCIIEKYHMTERKNKLPISKNNPFKRLWTKWVKKGENIRYPSLMLFNHDEK